MSEEVGSSAVPKKKPIVRYFSDAKRTDGAEGVERIKTDQSRKPHAFVGDVIAVKEKAKFFGKSKWQNRRPDVVGQYQKGKRKMVQLKVDPYARERHSRGAKITGDGIKTDHFKEKYKRKEVYNDFATDQAARAELLLNEEEGFIEAEDGVATAEYTQSEIVANVDITAASKHFNLNLNFGPYRMRYTKNGRHLLIGGRKGHVAAFDWITKKLHCEFNVMEEVTDVTWLHVETMFAVAQKNWVHFYDNQGLEIHCVKGMHHVTRLDFLPYHFLAVSGSDAGFLSWLDVSTGTMVANYPSRMGPVRMMTHNPYNGVTCIGSSKGVVSMWSPTVQEPLAKMLCHSAPLSALTVDPKGMYLTTAGVDKHVKVWDIRSLSGPIIDYGLRSPAQEIVMSQRGLLAIAMGNLCEIYKKPNLVSIKAPYLRHRCNAQIHGMQFCPFEDVLGVTTDKGFTSLLVPGSGEPNFDALEANPFQTKTQRKESEVHALLEKIPPELIKLNPHEVAQVDVPTLRENIEAKKSLLVSHPVNDSVSFVFIVLIRFMCFFFSSINLQYLKAPKVDFKQRNKMKGKGGSVNAFKAKKIVRDQTKKSFLQDIRGVKQDVINEYRNDNHETAKNDEPHNVLDRFKPKKKKKV